MSDAASISTLDEIHVLLKELPGPSREAAKAAEEETSAARASVLCSVFIIISLLYSSILFR